MKIFCCNCNKDVIARLTSGAEVYSHRKDLREIPFWKCDECLGHVGCHHKTLDKVKPLGVIPSKDIKNARQHIHKILDPLWQSGKMKRGDAYKRISQIVGWDFHTAEIRNLDQAREVYKAIRDLSMDHLQE